MSIAHDRRAARALLKALQSSALDSPGAVRITSWVIPAISDGAP